MSSRKKLSVEDQIVYRKFRNRQDITYIAEQVCVTEDFARNVILEELLRRYGALEIEKESMEEVCERCEVNYEQVREYLGYEGLRRADLSPNDPDYMSYSDVARYFGIPKRTFTRIKERDSQSLPLNPSVGRPSAVPKPVIENLISKYQSEQAGGPKNFPDKSDFERELLTQINSGRGALAPSIGMHMYTYHLNNTRRS